MTGHQKKSNERTPLTANGNAPLLTTERAIADSLPPLRIRLVAQSNIEAGGRRRARQADNLIKIAERLELLGYRGAA